jgi:hypothetical protein
MDEHSPLEQRLLAVKLAAPLQTVWRALREPELIASWFGWDAPTLAEEIRFIFLDTATADDTRHVLSFGEWEGASDRIELAALDGGTEVKLIRRGGAPLDWSGSYDAVAEGWVTFAEQLRLALDRHLGEHRRTIYLSGAAMGEDTRLFEKLGLASALGNDVGTPYDAPLPFAEPISGTLWHKTHFQLGVLVEQWGDGLLVASDMGVSPRRPHGGGSVLITTYGVSDSQFAELEQRWRSWWDGQFKAASE